MRRIIPLLLLATVLLAAGALRAQEDPAAIPDPAPIISEDPYDIVNFLLLGSDTTNPANAGRTDVLLIVSVNRTAGTVAMLSLPRDLWVYVPGATMQRINTAFAYGENNGEGGQGPRVIADTILYNLGITIDHVARVDFNGFRELIDSVGGIEISVDCAIQDWRLREPDLDPAQEDNWEMFTLPVGVHHMDGHLALWYVRSRRTSSDFDRGRRQQAVMRALWQRIRGLGLLDQLPDLWPQVLETVKTDITVDEMLSLVPLALTLDSAHLASYTFRLNQEVRAWRSPDGASVLVPQREAVADLMRRVMLPPTESQIVQEQPSIEIVNASGFGDLARVAADRLALEGFVPRISDERPPYRDYTMIYDYSGDTKSGSLARLREVLRVSDESIRVEPTAERTVDFRVVLGGAYNTCTYGVLPPSPIDDDDSGDAGDGEDVEFG